MKNFSIVTMGLISLALSSTLSAQQNIHGSSCAAVEPTDSTNVRNSFKGITNVSAGSVSVICSVDRTDLAADSLTVTVLAENLLTSYFPPYTPTEPITCRLGTIQRNGFSPFFDSAETSYTSSAGKVHTFSMTLDGLTYSQNRNAVTAQANAYLNCDLPPQGSIAGINVL